MNESAGMVTSAPPRRGTSGLAGRGVVLAGLLAATAWNLTRTGALAEAEAAYRRGDFASGLNRAQDHLDRRPWSRRAALLAALCSSRLDFADAAEPYYRRAGPLGLDDLQTRAYGLVRANRRREAESAYREILEHYPDDPLALRRLGALLMTMMRWDEALALAERLSRRPGDEVDGLSMVAAIQHHEDKAAAVDAYRRLFAIDPRLLRLPSNAAFRRVFWTQLTEDYLATGRAAEGRRLLEDAPPGDRGPTLTWLLGRVDSEQGDLDRADRRWREAVRADPGLADAWIDLGRLALARERPGEAIPLLERAAALDPRAYAPAQHLALAYQALGQPDRARRYRDRVELIRRGPPGTAGATASPGPPRQPSDSNPP